MIFVITGAPFSGKNTMALAMLSSNPNVIQVPILSTASECHNFCDGVEVHSLIGAEEFSERKANNEFVGTMTYRDAEHGVLKTDLDKIVNSSAKAVLVVNPDMARRMGFYFRTLGIQSACIYMHCSIRSMLFRLAASKGKYGDCDYETVHDIYADHAIFYSNIHRDFESGEGYDRVVPVNSDKLTGIHYSEKTTDPVFRILQNLENEPH